MTVHDHRTPTPGDPHVVNRMTEATVIVLQGARSVGKSTVLAELARQHDVEITDR